MLSRSKALVPSKTLKLPVLSSKSLVAVFSRYTRVSGLPEHVESVYREDLTLAALLSILEHDLEHLQEGSCLFRNCS